MSIDSSLEFAKTTNGYVIRLIGHGTMRVSPAFRELAEKCFERASTQEVFVDLTSCSYLDSTFLGCLLYTHKRFRDFDVARFALVVEPGQRTKLFATSTFDRLFEFVEQPPELVSPPVTFSSKQLESEEFGRHVLDCHLRLAELGDKESPKYRAIADRLSQELDRE